VGDYCPQSTNLEGTIDGAPVALDTVGPYFDGGVIPLAGGALLWLQHSDVVVTRGVLGVTRGNPTEGFDLYCIDDGTFQRDQGTLDGKYILTQLSRLGTCADSPPTGRLTGCSGF
jgi:hypothetical protein